MGLLLFPSTAEQQNANLFHAKSGVLHSIATRETQKWAKTGATKMM
jgi:hypothetical protein